jgi:hypothetical protein
MVIWCRLRMDFLFINGVGICRFFKFFDVVFVYGCLSLPQLLLVAGILPNFVHTKIQLTGNIWFFSVWMAWLMCMLRVRNFSYLYGKA